MTRPAYVLSETGSASDSLEDLSACTAASAIGSSVPNAVSRYLREAEASWWKIIAMDGVPKIRSFARKGMSSSQHCLTQASSLMSAMHFRGKHLTDSPSDFILVGKERTVGVVTFFLSNKVGLRISDELYWEPCQNKFKKERGRI